MKIRVAPVSRNLDVNELGMVEIFVNFNIEILTQQSKNSNEAYYTSFKGVTYLHTAARNVNVFRKFF